MLRVFYLTLFFYTFHVKSQDDYEGYTWEDYNGNIPPNALQASDDPTNPVYIGMATINKNNCPGTLIPGATEIMVQCFGIHTVKEDLKILTVEDKTKFRWVSTKKGSFWRDVNLPTSEPVTLGLHYGRHNVWTIGRTTTDNGAIEVGHVANNVLHYIHNNQHKRKDKDYQVLNRDKNYQPTSPSEPTPANKEAVDECKKGGRFICVNSKL